MRLTLLSCTAALLAAPAFAADLGTYRPGTPYHSVIVPTANVCESQCDGDAQCRGWNYVKAAPKAPGVCEFQSVVSEPISSAISISGVSNSAAPMSTRVIEGNTNTIRVGTTVTPKPATTRTTSTGRQIVRQSVPGGYPSGYVARQPGLRPALDGYAGAQPRMAQPVITRGPARQSPQMRNVRTSAPQVLRAPAYGQPQYAPSYQGRPPIGQPIAPPNTPTNTTQAYTALQGPSQTYYQAQPQPAANYSSTQTSAAPQPQTYGQRQAFGQPQGPSVPASQDMPRSSAANPVSWDSVRAAGTTPRRASAPQQSSLYGTLNDDVAPQNSMPTTGSYPSQPVTQMPLAGAYSGGAQPR